MGTNPIEASVALISEKLNNDPTITLIDVREESERELCFIQGSIRLTEALAEEIIGSWQPDTELVFYCHHGIRSRAAAEYFLKQGFKNVFNMTGGIEAWSLLIDTQVPRY